VHLVMAKLALWLCGLSELVLIILLLPLAPWSIAVVVAWQHHLTPLCVCQSFTVLSTCLAILALAAGPFMCPGGVFVQNTGNVRLTNITLTGDVDCNTSSSIQLEPYSGYYCNVSGKLERLHQAAHHPLPG